MPRGERVRRRLSPSRACAAAAAMIGGRDRAAGGLRSGVARLLSPEGRVCSRATVIIARCTAIYGPSPGGRCGDRRADARGARLRQAGRHHLRGQSRSQGDRVHAPRHRRRAAGADGQGRDRPVDPLADLARGCRCSRPAAPRGPHRRRTTYWPRRSAYPARFAGLAAVAPQPPESAAAEIERAKKLGLVGLAAAEPGGAPERRARPGRPETRSGAWSYQVPRPGRAADRGRRARHGGIGCRRRLSGAGGATAPRLSAPGLGVSTRGLRVRDATDARHSP